MTDDCLFCRIASGSLASTKVYEDDDVVAFNDIHPAAPIHVLLIPRKHIASLADVEAGDEKLVGELVRRAKILAEELGVAANGYRLVFNIRKHAGQVVDHLHLHLIGGKQLGHLV